MPQSRPLKTGLFSPHGLSCVTHAEADFGTVANSSGSPKHDGHDRPTASSHLARRPPGSAAPLWSAAHSTYHTAATKFIFAGGSPSMNFSPRTDSFSTVAVFSRSWSRNHASAA